MKITYFAWLKDKVGCEEEEISLPVGVTNVGQLINWLSMRGPQYEDAFEFIEVIKVVVNQMVVLNDHLLKEDDEVIFIPPIAGG
jgi:molybdopterin synthase sulfur carrier subunit